MVKICASCALQEYLSSKGVQKKEVYEYKDIRPFLVDSSPEVLENCSFSWPKKPTPKVSPYIQKIIEKRKEREYLKMTANLKPPQPQQFSEFKSGLGLGMTFISVLFVGMLSGYYLGKYYLGLSDWGSLVVSFIVTVIGVYVEVILYLIQTEGKNYNKQKTE